MLLVCPLLLLLLVLVVCPFNAWLSLFVASWGLPSSEFLFVLCVLCCCCFWLVASGWLVFF